MTSERDSTKQDHLRESEIFRDLTADELRDVENLSSMTTCERGCICYEPGETGEVLFFLKKGCVTLYRMTEDGRKLVTGTVQVESVFGEMSLLGR